MLGGIYSSENCPVCGLRMKDNHRDAVCCPKHPKQRAKSLILKFGRGIKLRFTEYLLASRELTAMRRDTDLNRFDERDFKAHSPLGFYTIAYKYLEFKKREVEIGKFGKRSLAEITRDLDKASEFFGQENIRELSTVRIKEFEISLSGLAPKTVANIIASVRAMHRYMVECDEFVPLKKIKWPAADLANMGFRKTVSKETQEAILNEVKTLSADNPRIWLGIRWLSIYTAIRPGELFGILEKDVDLTNGLLTIRNHKTARRKGPKIIPLLESDLEILKNLPRGFPEMYLFRRDKGGGGHHANTPFGYGIFYDYWKMACMNLGVSDVDLYGGTRHSTQRFYRRHMSTEDCYRLSQHTTSKAGARYLELDQEELLAGYALADRTTGPPTDHPKRKVTSLKD